MFRRLSRIGGDRRRLQALCILAYYTNNIFHHSHKKCRNFCIFAPMNNRTKLVALYITVVLPMIALTVCSCIFADYRLACLLGGIMLIFNYLPALKFGITPYCQQHIIILPCSKHRMLFYRLLHAIAQPYSLAFIAIMLIAILCSPLTALSKILAFLLCGLQCIAITSACVVGENLYNNKQKAIRGALQYLFCVGAIIPPLIANSKGVDEFLLFSPLWWAITITMIAVSSILFPFAKRWIV